MSFFYSQQSIRIIPCPRTLAEGRRHLSFNYTPTHTSQGFELLEPGYLLYPNSYSKIAASEFLRLHTELCWSKVVELKLKIWSL